MIESVHNTFKNRSKPANGPIEHALREREAWLAGQKLAFQSAIKGQPLAVSLGALVNTVIAHTNGEARAAFFMVPADAEGLQLVAGMTDEYAKDVNGFKAGPESLACGLAMHTGEPAITRNVEEDPLWAPFVQITRKHNYRSCWSFPVRIEDGTLLGTLAFYFEHQREPKPADLEMAGILTHTAAIIITLHKESTERASAERIRNESEEKYRILFNSMDEGVVTLQLFFDDAGKTIDFCYLEHNAAVTRQTGLTSDIVGKKLSELFPNLEQYWLDAYGRVAKTGEPERHEYYFVTFDSWFDIYISCIGPPGGDKVVCVYNNITERKRNELRQSYILKLMDALRPLSDPAAIEQQVTQAAMEYFNADRCFYCDIEDREAIIRKDARCEGLPSVAGAYPLDSFVLFKKVIDLGNPLVVYDVRDSDNIDPELRDLCVQLQVISFVDIPVIKEGKTLGIFCLVQSKPRQWQTIETQLAGETAELCWAAVAKAKADTELQESEARYRNESARMQATLKSIGDAVYIGDASGITLANQPALDQLGYSSYEDLKRNISTLSAEIQTRNAETNEVISPEKQAFARALTGEYSTQNVRIRRLQDGSERILRSAASPVIVDGKIVAAVAVNTDITEQWQTAEALRQSEQKLREFNNTLEQQIKERAGQLLDNHKLLESIYNTTHVGMSVFKPVYTHQNSIKDFEIIIVNKRIEDSSGRSDLPGKMYAEEFPGVKKMGLFDMMVKTMETGEHGRIEYFYEHEGVHRWYSTMCVKTGDTLVCSNLDMTEQKQAEEKNSELIREQQALEARQQQAIFRTILDTQEVERKRIAENLHNSLGQILYGAKLTLGQVLSSQLTDSDKENLRNADKLLNDAITESRRMSHELMPVILEDFGLKIAVVDICRQLSGSTQFKCRFKGLVRRLDKYLEVAIYRIIQELMTNIVKHAKATEALVAIEIHKDQLLILVQDNGKGFSGRPGKNAGIGLKTIQNKVSLLNGNINMQSTADGGTIINVNVSLKTVNKKN